MKMTRQHFQALAEMVADVTVELDFHHKQEACLTDHVLFICRRSNPNFDIDRFCAAIEKQKKIRENLLTVA